MDKVRVRFAPSPTGPLHIGGARSALFNYLFAKKNNGDFIVRIEDTDLERSSHASEENIKESLHWLGIDWNEGIDVGGPHMPYRQMERLHTYTETAQQLLDVGKAYYCYCSEEEVEQERQAALARGAMPNYSGRCRHLTAEERAEKEAQGIKPVIRFHVEPGEPVHIADLVRGDVYFEREGIGDFVIVKSDGIPVYNFAVVVDDHFMDISHVLRGEEHLSNTPRQIVLYEALGWEKPVFGHISLILGKDRSKMSKRNGDVSVVNYQDAGFLPEALVNFLALLGWAPEGEEEIFSMKQLEEVFSLERVSKSPAVFDMDKLKWLNGQYLHQMSNEEVAQRLLPYVGEIAQLDLLAETLKNHLNTFSEAKEFLPLFQGEAALPLDEEAVEVLKEETVPQVLALFAEKVTALEDFSAESIKGILKSVRKETGLGGASVFMPVRVALTGTKHGPDIDKLAALMGREVLLKRLQTTMAKIKQEV